MQNIPQNAVQVQQAANQHLMQNIPQNAMQAQQARPWKANIWKYAGIFFLAVILVILLIDSI